MKPNRKTEEMKVWNRYNVVFGDLALISVGLIFAGIGTALTIPGCFLVALAGCLLGGAFLPYDLRLCRSLATQED